MNQHKVMSDSPNISEFTQPEAFDDPRDEFLQTFDAGTTEFVFEQSFSDWVLKRYPGVKRYNALPRKTLGQV